MANSIRRHAWLGRVEMMFYAAVAKCRYWRARLRAEWMRFLIRLSGGRCGHHLWVGRGVVLKFPTHAGLRFGDHVRLGEYMVVDVPAGGVLKLGDHVSCSMGVVLASLSSVSLGSGVLVGEYSSIRDADHGKEVGAPIWRQSMRGAPIVIGDDVWLGRGAGILRSVELDRGSVLGANSAVTRPGFSCG